MGNVTKTLVAPLVLRWSPNDGWRWTTRRTGGSWPVPNRSAITVRMLLNPRNVAPGAVSTTSSSRPWDEVD